MEKRVALYGFPTEDHEEIHHRWVVAVAWLGFDRGNGVSVVGMVVGWLS